MPTEPSLFELYINKKGKIAEYIPATAMAFVYGEREAKNPEILKEYTLVCRIKVGDMEMEIYVNRDGELIKYIPATGKIFELVSEGEVEDLDAMFKEYTFVCQVNLEVIAKIEGE